VDGTIYLGGGSAIDQAGNLLWNTWSTIPIGDSTLAPALTADGILVTHDEHGIFHGFHDGKLVWNAAAGGGPTSSVIIGPDATIYAAGGATVFALR
jgi:outer membrane protein assembly factor BamB